MLLPLNIGWYNCLCRLNPYSEGLFTSIAGMPKASMAQGKEDAQPVIPLP